MPDRPYILIADYSPEYGALVEHLVEEVLGDARDDFRIEVFDDAGMLLHFAESIDDPGWLAIVFADYYLPGPVNGVGLLRRVKQLAPKTQTVLYYAVTPRQDLQAAQGEGVIDLHFNKLARPDLDHLSERIKSLFVAWLEHSPMHRK